MSRPEGISLADAAYQVLQTGLAPNGKHWTLDEATARLNDTPWRKFTPADWREAVAYLTLQLITSRTHDGEAERLAIFQIRTIVNRLEQSEKAEPEQEGLFG